MKRLLIVLLTIFFNTEITKPMYGEYDFNPNDKRLYIEVPENHILQRGFNELILKHFFSLADNIKEIAGKEMHVLKVLAAVNKDLNNYAKSEKVDRQTALFTQSLKPEILEILFLNAPDGLIVLKKIMSELSRVRNSGHKIRVKIN